MAEDVSKQDREAFRDRFKASVKAAKSSQKKLEIALDLPSGTFTKVYSGKAELTGEILVGAAKILQANAAEWVKDTAFASLLEDEATAIDAPPTPRELPKEDAPSADDKAAEAPTEVDEDEAKSPPAPDKAAADKAAADKAAADKAAADKAAADKAAAAKAAAEKAAANKVAAEKKAAEDQAAAEKKKAATAQKAEADKKKAAETKPADKGPSSEDQDMNWQPPGFFENLVNTVKGWFS